MKRNCGVCIVLIIITLSMKSTDFEPAYQRVTIETLKQEIDLPTTEIEKMLRYFFDFEKSGQGAWVDSYDILPGLINQYGLSVGCEVGVAHGFHSYVILKATNVKKLYSVDPYRHFESHLYQDAMNYEQHKFDILYHIVKARLSVFDNRSVFIRRTSQEAAALFQDNELDFVYIDANHSYKAVKEDLEAWWSKVRPGGIVSGDDYAHISFPGVTQAVDEFFAAKGLKINQHPVVKRFYWVVK